MNLHPAHLLMLFVGLAPMEPAFAQSPSLYGNVLTQISRDEGAEFHEDGDSLPDPLEPVIKSARVQTSSGSPSLVDASAEANVEIRYGLIRGQASAFLHYGGVTTDFASATVTAISQDMITVTAPGAAGTVGTLTARIRVSGFGNASKPGTPDPSGFLSVGSSYIVQLLSNGNPGWNGIDGAWVSSEDGPFIGKPLNQAYSLSVPFIFGEPWELGLEVGLLAQVHPLPGEMGNYSGSINLSNTITWLGIESISDELGEPVSGVTLTSESGFDWMKAHPSAVASKPLVLKIESFDGDHIFLTIDNIPSGQMFHVRQSSDGETFDPVTPPLDISDATPQPISLPVDRAAHPTLLVQVYEGTSPAP